MLIRFKVANFLSFKDETEFSMVAGKERIHPNHVIKGNRNQPNLLRSALLYGANAAGKSNFVKAIDFAKTLITTRDGQFIENQSFRFDSKLKDHVSKFCFEFVFNDKTFEYGFWIDSESIKKEWLFEESSTKKTVLFDRTIDAKGLVHFSESDLVLNGEDKSFLQFVQRSVLHTELFLSHSADNNVVWFKVVFDWFYYSLQTFFPETKDYQIGMKLYKNNTFKDFFIKTLSKLGTGINAVQLKKNDNPKKLQMQDRHNFTNNFVDVSLLHNNILFKDSEESSGTQRLMDLAFPFYDLMTSETPKVYIIDELENSLHTNLSYSILKSYLEQGGNNQLIATTHDTHLLDLELLRKDEIWFAEKNNEGATELYSLIEFNPRYDKKIEKEYLTGRFGAIPFLGNMEFKRKLSETGKK
jgi:uncharacterized protein